MDKKMFNKFFEFVYDRQYIYRMREARAPWPWSENEILNTYRFCNVYRELDKCSLYLIDSIIKDGENLSLGEKIVNIILYRRFNTPNFFEVIKGPYNFERNPLELLPLLDRYKKTGNVLFNTAYIICQVPFNKNKRKGDKHAQVIYAFEDFVKSFEFEPFCGNLKAQATYDYLKENCYGFGGFMAYQVLVDISYLAWFPKEQDEECKIVDLEKFVDVGPGAVAGLQAVFPEMNPRYKSDFCRKLHALQAEGFAQLLKRTGKDWDDVRLKKHPNKQNGRYLALNNVQNCLCEFRKYLNLSQGKGRKRIYRREA